MADGYNDTITPEEEALLRSEEQNAAIPPAEDDDSNPIPPQQVAAEQGLNPDGTPKEAAPTPAATPAADPAAPPVPVAQPTTDADRRAAFLAAHKDKTPEQLLDLAFQQEGRANRAGFTARQSKEQLDAIQNRATAAIERVRAKREQLGTQRTEFDQQLQNDPDGATRAVHERLMSAEDQALADEERAARRDTAIAMATTAIPHFDMDATTAFGAEMNYTPEELDGVTDPRDIVTLHLASLTGRLIKAGVMDVQGNLIATPPAVQATDPRLAAPAPVTTLSSAPARGNNGGQTLEQQLTDITNMTDAQMEEFEKANPGMLENLLRKAN